MSIGRILLNWGDTILMGIRFFYLFKKIPSIKKKATALSTTKNMPIASIGRRA